MSQPQFTLRPAALSDDAFVYRLKQLAIRPHVEATWGWDEAEQRALHRRRFRPDESEIIQVGAEPVGFLYVRRTPDEIQLVAIYLLPAWQSHGIGSRILRDLAREAEARQVPLRLRVLRVNDRAHALYTRHGFATTETTDTHHYLTRM